MIENTNIINDLNNLKNKSEEIKSELDEKYFSKLSLLKEDLEKEDNEEKKLFINNEIEALNKDYEESKELMKNVIESMNLENEENSSYKTSLEMVNVIQVIEHLEKKILEEKDSNTQLYYLNQIKLLKDTIELKRIKNKIMIKDKKSLKKDFESLRKNVYLKIKSEKNILFPNINYLKLSLKEIFNEVYPDMNEKDINNNSKILGSIILKYIMEIKLYENRLFVYYLLDNIINIEKLPIEEQIRFRNNLIGLGNKYLKINK